eukprot:6667129-Alexandrium_andersonii.AAC.1
MSEGVAGDDPVSNCVGCVSRSTTSGRSSAVDPATPAPVESSSGKRSCVGGVAGAFGAGAAAGARAAGVIAGSGVGGWVGGVNTGLGGVIMIMWRRG